MFFAEPVVINCGGEAGTAFAIEQQFMTAQHVADQGVCRVGTVVVRPLSRTGDIASGRALLPQFKHSCDPMQVGEQYRLAGYPAGTSELTITFARVTRVDVDIAPRGGYTMSNMVELSGTVIRGMSGGPVLNSNDEVVGVISASSATRTYIQPLHSTRFCR